MTEILPEMFSMAAEGKLKVENLSVGIESIEQHWDTAIPVGSVWLSPYELVWPAI